MIVLTHNAERDIRACLERVRLQDYPAVETIVVDNASTDGTVAIVRDFFPDVVLVTSERNGGYGAGNNLGARHATGAVLVFLNPDTLPEPSWLRELVQPIASGCTELATSLIALQSDPGRLNSGGNLIHYLGFSYCRGLGADRQDFAIREIVSGASGAACAITRRAFDTVGGFDESFFLYHDDVDLSIRALLAGYRCLYVPSAIVLHDYELLTSPQKWAWTEAHRYAILLKVFRFRTLGLLLPALAVLDAALLVYFALKGGVYVRAKLSSYRWVARHVPAIVSGRRRAQRSRASSDRALLEALAATIPYEQIAGPRIAGAARLMVDPALSLYRALLLRIVTW